ncbi:hypothetical protein H5410_010215 [Solanum commersonii]|uniref:Uncharacterized protein n=1 Tax=Solanum commersonii TaxID=4109 RepID=A0A9J6AK39_SOLCO|nr:hypothetical protein H5410_010215 [Solanum commersonii]
MKDYAWITLRLGAGPERNHRTGTEWVDWFVDRYQDEPDRNYRYGYTVPSRPTIYRDGTGMERDGINGTTHLAISKNDKKKISYFNFLK